MCLRFWNLKPVLKVQKVSFHFDFLKKIFTFGNSRHCFFHSLIVFQIAHIYIAICLPQTQLKQISNSKSHQSCLNLVSKSVKFLDQVKPDYMSILSSVK